MKMHTISLMLLTISMASANAYAMFPLVPDKTGQSLGFPDVCKTPASDPTVAIPYPNVVDKSESDFVTGTKKAKGGGEVQFTEQGIPSTNSLPVQGLAVTLVSRSGTIDMITKSQLIELEDGSYCAICVKENRVTALLRLVPVGQALTITLTGEQMAQVSKAGGNEITVKLTREQYAAIKKQFPKLGTMKMRITLPKSGPRKAAPFIPGGAVLSVAVSGVNQMQEATGSISDGDDD